MAGSLGLSTLVCLMNNGTEEKPTSANLLGPFWRKGSPVMSNGDSIVRSPTEGPPLFFTGTVLDTDGNPVAGAEIDVWHASPVGLYENQDPDQAEWNLRGKFVTDDDGMFNFRTIKPSGYPIPITGPVGDLLAALDRHPFRPAHVHAMVYKPGYKTITSQIYSHDDPMLDTDAQFGVTGPLIARYLRHEDEPRPGPGRDRAVVHPRLHLRRRAGRGLAAHPAGLRQGRVKAATRVKADAHTPPDRGTNRGLRPDGSSDTVSPGEPGSLVGNVTTSARQANGYTSSAVRRRVGLAQRDAAHESLADPGRRERGRRRCCSP